MKPNQWPISYLLVAQTEDHTVKSLHPFILRPRFLQFLEIWFEKSGSRNLVREKWLTRKKGGFIL